MSTQLRLILGIFIISWSSIIIRWMGAIDPLLISFYRLFFSALILLPLVLKDFQPQTRLSFSLLPYLLLAGLFLALHFYTWITSLQLTSVGNSIFLECTHPFWGWLLSMIFLKERASRAFLWALPIGILGMYLTVSSDFEKTGAALLGDFLAIIAAFCLAAYLLVARALRAKMPLLTYLFFVYGSAAAFLLVAILFYRLEILVIPLKGWLLLGLLALGPNLIGHSLLNWASRKMPVYKVNMALLSESVLATFYAGLILGEIPPGNFYFGAFFILAAIGIVLYLHKESK